MGHNMFIVVHSPKHTDHIQGPLSFHVEGAGNTGWLTLWYKLWSVSRSQIKQLQNDMLSNCSCGKCAAAENLKWLS